MNFASNSTLFHHLHDFPFSRQTSFVISRSLYGEFPDISKALILSIRLKSHSFLSYLQSWQNVLTATRWKDTLSDKQYGLRSTRFTVHSLTVITYGINEALDTTFFYIKGP